MRCQVGALGEPLVTVWVHAEVGLFTSVSSQVSPEVEIEREPLAAQFALEGFFPGMHKLVSFQLRIV